VISADVSSCWDDCGHDRIRPNGARAVPTTRPLYAGANDKPLMPCCLMATRRWATIGCAGSSRCGRERSRAASNLAASALSRSGDRGQALMADSVGRFEIWIHGANVAQTVGSQAQNGSVRLADPSMLAFAPGAQGSRGHIVQGRRGKRRARGPRVWADDFFDEAILLRSMVSRASRNGHPGRDGRSAAHDLSGRVDGGGTTSSDAGDHAGDQGKAGTGAETEKRTKKRGKGRPIGIHDAGKGEGKAEG